MIDKKEIYYTAYSLFQKNGYNNVTVNEICKECGITKPTFYNYISSKDEILSFYFKEVAKNFTGNAKKYAINDNYWQAIKHCFDVLLTRVKEFGPELYQELYIANLKNKELHSFDFISNQTPLMTELFQLAKEKGQIQNTTEAKELYLICLEYCYSIGMNWMVLNNNTGYNKDVFFEGIANICSVPEEYR